jgi:hypothetical protein
MGLTFTNDFATISTSEYSLPADTISGVPTSQTNDGVYQVFIDFGAMAAGDQYCIRLYEKTDSGGTQRLVEEWILTGAQSKPMFILPSVMLGEGWDITVLKLAGSDRSIRWSIRQVT